MVTKQGNVSERDALIGRANNMCDCEKAERGFLICRSGELQETWRKPFICKRDGSIVEPV